MKVNLVFVDEARMEGIGILRVLKEEMSVKALRETIVKEWLDYETDYLGFSTADSFRDEAERYRENGYFGPGNTWLEIISACDYVKTSNNIIVLAAYC